MIPIPNTIQTLLDAMPAHPLEQKVTLSQLPAGEKRHPHAFYSVITVLDSDSLSEQQIAEKIRAREIKTLTDFDAIAKDDRWTLTVEGSWKHKRATQFLHCPNRGDGSYYFRCISLVDAAGTALTSPHHGEAR